MQSSASQAIMDERLGEIFIFGDQTDTFRASLRVLLDVKVDPILQQYFKESYRHLRAEVLLQSSVDFDVSDQRSSSLLELLDLNFKGPQAVALGHALATVCHFGLFLEKCRKSQGVYPHRKITKHVGICTGSLAAAAITCCQSSLEPLPVAFQTVILAYRLGAHAAETGGPYHGGERGSQCWSIAVPNTGAEYATEAIARFAATKVSYQYGDILNSSDFRHLTEYDRICLYSPGLISPAFRIRGSPSVVHHISSKISATLGAFIQQQHYRFMLRTTHHTFTTLLSSTDWSVSMQMPQIGVLGSTIDIFHPKASDSKCRLISNCVKPSQKRRRPCSIKSTLGRS